MRNSAFAILASLAILFSCNKEEDNITAVGDVYIVSTIMDTDTVYGLSIHAYSLYPFSSVTASVNTTTHHLQAYPGYKTDFHYDTPDSELSTEIPTTGEYQFSVSFENGKTDNPTDILTNNALFPPVINSCIYNETTKKASIQWEAVYSADLYIINLFEGDELVLRSPDLDPTYTIAQFSSTSTSWIDGYTPKAGTSFTLRLSAFKYEAGGDNFNLQASSLTEETIVWGE